MPQVSHWQNSEHGKVLSEAGFLKCERHTAY